MACKDSTTTRLYLKNVAVVNTEKQIASLVARQISQSNLSTLSAVV